MNLFIKKFNVRWSDLDANRHVANSAYLNFMSHTRMAYLMSHGFNHEDMKKLNTGPVIFHEHLNYFREVLPGQTVILTLQLKGLSKDGMFFEFEHNIYAEDGTHHIYTELMGGFIDLQTRKLTGLPEELTRRVFDDLERTADFRWLTKEDTRKHQKRPSNRPELMRT